MTIRKFRATCQLSFVLASLSFVNMAYAAALAPGFTSSPGQIIYSYASPQVGIYAGVQVGNSVAANVTQTSAHNVSGVVQVGNTTNANVKQTGSVNNTFVSQFSHLNSAFVIQFGQFTSMLSQ